MSGRRWLDFAVATTALLTVVACGDDDGAGGVASDGGGGGAGGVASGGAGGGTTTITVSGNVVDGLSMSPLSGAEVCVEDPPGLGCATTAGDGAFTFEDVPASVRATATIEKMGYLSTLGVFDLGAEDAVVPVTMLSEALATAAYSQVGVTLDTSLGGIAFVVSGTSVIGYVGTLTPMAGDGPWYLDGFGLNPNASSTTADGTGSFVNIPPGDYTLTLTGPGTCVPKLSASDAPDTYLAPVRSGFLTAVVTECQ